jgi:hypothetical protein
MRQDLTVGPAASLLNELICSGSTGSAHQERFHSLRLRDPCSYRFGKGSSEAQLERFSHVVGFCVQGDLGEYNQCQSQLRHLYELGLQGHPEEFLAYRILYLLHTRNRRGTPVLTFQSKLTFD